MKNWYISAVIAALFLFPAIPQAEAAPAAVLYEHFNYKGKHLAANGNVSQLKGWWNDQISSVIISSGYAMIAYEHHNFKGRSKYFEGMVNLKGWWNDKISSFKITNPHGIVLFAWTGRKN